MRRLLLTLAALLFTLPSFAKPVLVLLETDALKKLDSNVQVLRSTDSGILAACEEDALTSSGVPFTVLDAAYEPGHYLLVRAGHTTDKIHSVIWQDAHATLIKLPEIVTEFSGGETPLGRQPASAQASRRPSHLDDAATDQWLTQLAAAVNMDSLAKFDSTLATYNRYARYASNDSAAAWIYRKLHAYGYDSLYYFPFNAHSGSWTHRIFDVIAIKPGTESPDSIVIIGGHMDATSENPSTAAPGADDNGTGASCVVEAARVLAPYSFRRTIMFCAFNAEEQGMQGSDSLAHSMAVQHKPVLAVVNMDMLGYAASSSTGMWIEGFNTGTNSQWLVNALADNCHQFSTLSTYLYPDNGWGSDHEAFWWSGFPAVLAIEDDYESYPCYHRTCDLPSQVSKPFFRQMSAVCIVTAAELAAPLGSAAISGTTTLAGASDFSSVRVSVVGGDESALSQSNGFYRVTGLLPGTYALAFARDGWRNDTLRNIIVTTGQETPNHNISLTTAASSSISGTIALSGGSGVLTAAIVFDGNPLVHPDGSGHYALTGLWPGTHVVTAALSGYALGSQTVTLTEGQNLTNVNITLYPSWDLESGNYGLNNSGTGWAWGTDATPGAHSGTKVWGTVLGGNYANCANYTLDMPAVSLAHLDSARLTLWHWYDIEPNGTLPYDGGNVKIAPFGTNNWTLLQPVGNYPSSTGGSCNPLQYQAAYAGSGTTWRQASFNLNAFLGQTVRVRFQFGSDDATARRGWYLDDLALLGWPSAPAPNAVSGLTVTLSSGHPLLQWSANGAARYKIYRGTGADQPLAQMTLLATQTAATFTDLSAPLLSRAFYVVTAEN